MPKLKVVERDYPNLYRQWSTLGPLTQELGMVTKGINYRVGPEIEALKHAMDGDVAQGPGGGGRRGGGRLSTHDPSVLRGRPRHRESRAKSYGFALSQSSPYGELTQTVSF